MEKSLLNKLLLILSRARKQNFSPSDEYDIKHGGNGIVVFPTALDLQKYCLKTPMTGEFKEKIVQSVNENIREAYSNLYFTNGNFTNELLAYNQISSNPKLAFHIPKFHYLNEQLIIMDNIKGEPFELVGQLPNYENNEKTPLEETCCLFLQEGFTFGDKIEGVWDGEKIVFVDIGEISKN